MSFYSSAWDRYDSCEDFAYFWGNVQEEEGELVSYVQDIWFQICRIWGFKIFKDLENEYNINFDYRTEDEENKKYAGSGERELFSIIKNYVKDKDGMDFNAKNLLLIKV